MDSHTKRQEWYWSDDNPAVAEAAVVEAGQELRTAISRLELLVDAAAAAGLDVMLEAGQATLKELRGPLASDAIRGDINRRRKEIAKMPTEPPFKRGV